MNTVIAIATGVSVSPSARNISTTRRLSMVGLIAAISLASFSAVIQAQDGALPKVPKYSQLPVDEFGENLGSDVDWREIMFPPTQQIAPNWVIADDWVCDEGFPVNGVRWWGSYFNAENQPVQDPTGATGFVPVIEDGFIISFFRDIPISPDNPLFSRPGELLGSYIADISAVMINPTEMIGWDQHPIWQYEVMLPDMHLDHPVAGFSDPDAFRPTPGEIYWISIAAENGHRLGPDWQSIPTDDPVETEHFWGWHTSPDRFNDVAVMGDLHMPDMQWQYGNWVPAETVHFGDDMAFELLTVVPEPSSIVMSVIGMVALVAVGWRRRRRRA